MKANQSYRIVSNHQKNQTDYVSLTQSRQLIHHAQSRYDLATKAFAHALEPQSKRYWQGYQDALQDILQHVNLEDH